MEQTAPGSFGDYRNKLLFTVGLLLAVAFVLLFPSLVVLLFAAVLLATVLQGMGSWLANRLHLPYWTGITLAILALAVVLLGLAWTIGGPFVNQLDSLKESVSSSLRDLKAQVESSGLGRRLLAEVPPVGALAREVPARLVGVFSSVAGALTGTAVVLVIGIYMAVTPGLYVRGLIRLFPKPRRARMREVLTILGHALRFWMIGRMTSMVAVGILTGVGLWIVGLPLALSLGVLAGLFSFVPIVGPILAAVPGLLLAVSQSWTLVLYALAVYAGVQVLEGNLITPLVQQRTVSLPPVLLLASQTIAAAFVGLLGIVFATPLLVTIMVLVQLLYVQDVLGDDVKALGQK